MFKSGNHQRNKAKLITAHSRGDNGRRFILQQPLLYSETAYNYRRLGELWYQLMHSGIYC
jgi:hypothetical protein